MRIKSEALALVLGAGVFFVSGCADLGVGGGMSPVVTQSVMTYDTGTVQSVKAVVVKDNGAGTLVGAATGAVLGHMIGGGRGKDLATLGGGLLGAYAGDQIASANAQELTVRLDNGRGNVVVVAKGLRFSPGQRIRIVKNGSRLVSVEAL